MRYELLYQPSFAIARVMLDPGQSIRAEAGAMVSMSPSISLDSKMQGGIGKALGRLLGGESLFQSTFSATTGPGEVLLAPTLPGDILGVEVQGGLMVQSGSFLACDTQLELTTQASGRAFLGGEGLFLLRVTGVGTLLANAFGAIHPVQLMPGQPYIVDSGHIVAFSEGMGYEVRTVNKSLLGSLKSGEGFVVQLTGPGVVYVQTRTPSGFAGWVRQVAPSG